MGRRVDSMLFLAIFRTIVRCRRRLLCFAGAGIAFTAYLLFINLEQEAILSAGRVRRAELSFQSSLSGLTTQPLSLSPTSARTRRPTVTGYSLEMQFMSAARVSCPTQPLKTPKLAEDIAFSGEWQQPLDTTLFLYSAHYDDRMKAGDKRFPFVRVLAMSEGPLNGTLYCQLWKSNSLLDSQLGETQKDANNNNNVPPSLIVEAMVSEIWFPFWDQKAVYRSYRPYLLSCPLSKPQPAQIDLSSLSSSSSKLHSERERGSEGPAMVPKAVSIAPQPCVNPSSMIDIQGVDLEGQETRVTPSNKGDFAVCVKGMDFPNDISQRLVEWVELICLMGAQKISVYVYRVHPNVDRVLRYYQEKDLMEVIPLTLPGKQPNFPAERTKFLRRNAWQKRRNELVPYNDCFYRHARHYRFVIPLDIDEVIVPLHHPTWGAMIAHLERQDPELMPNHASISAPQVYFLNEKKLPSDSDSYLLNYNVFQEIKTKIDEIPSYMYMLKHIRRAANFTRPGHGIKSFMVSANCLTVFNHYALDVLYPGLKRDYVLPSGLVQLNHYKDTCPAADIGDCPLFTSYTKWDTTLWAYRDRLTPRVTNVLQQLRLLL